MSQFLGHLRHVSGFSAGKIGSVHHADGLQPSATGEFWQAIFLKSLAHQFGQIPNQLGLPKPPFNCLEHLLIAHGGDNRGSLNGGHKHRLCSHAACAVLGQENVLIYHFTTPVSARVFVGVQASTVKKLRLHLIAHVDLANDAHLLVKWPHDQAAQ